MAKREHPGDTDHMTTRAAQAFEDYYAMGAQRSFDKLLELYKKRKDPPTKRYQTIATWSTKYGWQQVIRERDKALAIELINQLQDEREIVLRSGLALDYERIKKLHKLWERLEEELETGALWLNDVKIVGRGEQAQVYEMQRFNSPLIRELRGILDDLAKEMGERTQRLVLEGDQEKPIPIKIVTVNLPPGALPEDDDNPSG